MAHGEDGEDRGTSDPVVRRLARAGAGTAAWTLVNAATRRSAAQTVEALRVEAIAGRLAQRYRRLGLAQRAGHLFEVMHELSFNLDAIAKGSAVRAATTEWAPGGSQSAAADLHLVEGGRLLASAQAKLMSDSTVGARSVVDGRYQGMQRLVPGDQLEAVHRILDKRLTLNPDGLGFEEYTDAEAHVTATLHVEDVTVRPGLRGRTGARTGAGSVRSTPVSSPEAHEAAIDPARWADRQVRRSAARQVGTAAATAAVTGAALAGVVEAARQAARVRAGQTTAASAAATAAGAAALQAVRSASVAGLGEAVSVAIAAGRLPATLGRGSTPAVIAGAVAEIAANAVAFGRGEIGTGTLAERCCETALRVTLVGALAALVPTTLGGPVVAGLVGGLVGQATAVLISQGLRTALAALRGERVPGPTLDTDDLDRRLAVLEDEAAAAVATAVLLGATTRELGEESDAYVGVGVSPLLDDALDAVTGADLDEASERVTEISRCFDGKPLFITVDEFDAWMADPRTTLSLDPNRA
ncbi:hypothetical protein ACFFKU_15360 [Kineococcus gynurae]|uniref:Uncharacterized protein n=1 Tax=Kineococcus gynurae TaxID=452979 RepID=A0ABV5LTE4_9ACTN